MGGERVLAEMVADLSVGGSGDGVGVGWGGAECAYGR